MRLSLVASASLSALLLAISPSARADGVLPTAATPVQREQAQSRFMRGKDLLEKKHYAEALVELRASHEIVASPNTRLEIARCLRQMDKIVEAYAELGRAAVEAKELKTEDDRYQRTYDAATSERADLEPRLGFVSLGVTNAVDETRVTIDGEEIRRAAWGEATPVRVGTTDVVVETPGHEPVKRSLTLAAGARTTLTIDAQSGTLLAPPSPPPPDPPPAPPPAAPSGLRTWAYVAGGAGVIGLAGFAIFGLMAHSVESDLSAACGNGPCPPGKTDDISRGKTDQTLANVGLALGIAGVAAGTTLFVLSMPKKTAAPSAALVVSPAWIGVRGSL